MVNRLCIRGIATKRCLKRSMNRYVDNKQCRQLCHLGWLRDPRLDPPKNVKA